jgi:hypothetical protein
LERRVELVKGIRCAPSDLLDDPCEDAAPLVEEELADV